MKYVEPTLKCPYCGGDVYSGRHEIVSETGYTAQSEDEMSFCRREIVCREPFVKDGVAAERAAERAVKGVTRDG